MTKKEVGEFEKRKMNIILGLEEPKTIMEFIYTFPSIPPMIPINLELLQKKVNEQSEWERKIRKKIEEAKQEFPSLSIDSELSVEEQHILLLLQASKREDWFVKWFK